MMESANKTNDQVLCVVAIEPIGILPPGETFHATRKDLAAYEYEEGVHYRIGGSCVHGEKSEFDPDVHKPTSKLAEAVDDSD